MKRNFTVLAILVIVLAVATTRTRAQSIYTPYAFTNFAGQPGGPGYADGTGSGARFHSPSGAAVDPAGDVYIADQNNFTIRKVTPAGLATTLAGFHGQPGTNDGTGSAARFGSIFVGPLGVAVDSAGNVYVTDTGNYTIRKITPAGVVTTLAGAATQFGSTDGTNGTARFLSPVGITVDNATNLYVTDGYGTSGGYTVRRITPGGVVTTLAGSPTLSGTTDGTNGAARFGYTLFGGPAGLAVDSATNLYVADTYNSTIRQISPVGTNWVVTTLSGGVRLGGFVDGTNGVARFDNPYGVAVDNAGNIYVTDSPAETIRKIASIGTNRVVTTFAGTAPVFGSNDGTGTAARFQTPEGAAVDSAGNVYVADFGNNTVRRITAAGVVTTLAGLAGGSGSADGVGRAAQFFLPHGVALDSATNLYVADTQNRIIRKITPAGDVTTIAGSAGLTGTNDGVGSAARFAQPLDIAADSSGNVYVADTSNFTIRKLTGSGTNYSVTTLAGGVGQQGILDGTGSAARFSGPDGVAADNVGNLYVADGYSIRHVSTGGTVTTLSGCPSGGCTNAIGSADGIGTAARFGLPAGVAVDNAGDLYVADYGNRTIRKLTATGWIVTTLAGSPGQGVAADGFGSEARFGGPSGIAVDGAGNVYVGDADENRIAKGTSLFLFDSSLLNVSNNAFQLRVTGPNGSNVVVDATANFQTWIPVQTNQMSPTGLNLSLPLGTNQRQLFRARLAP